MNYFLIGAAVLHALFMGAELFPWPLPALLQIASKDLPKAESFTYAQQILVATIVHNAGIYNGILAGGLSWAAFHRDRGIEVARVMLFGALVAGAFGTVTMKSPVTAVQGVVGLIGLFLIRPRQ